MESFEIGRVITITRGYCKGLIGKLIGFDKYDNEVIVRLDEGTKVIINVDWIKQ